MPDGFLKTLCAIRNTPATGQMKNGMFISLPAPDLSPHFQAARRGNGRLAGVVKVATEKNKYQKRTYQKTQQKFTHDMSQLSSSALAIY
jgi:hypothetical protein